MDDPTSILVNIIKLPRKNAIKQEVKQKLESASKKKRKSDELGRVE